MGNWSTRCVPEPAHELHRIDARNLGRASFTCAHGDVILLFSVTILFRHAACSQKNQSFNSHPSNNLTGSTPAVQQKRSFSTSSRAMTRSLHTSPSQGQRPSPGSLEYARSPAASSDSTSPPSAPYRPSHHAIPSTPSWSIQSLLDSTEPRESHDFTTEELLKLHKLAALSPPQDAAALEELKRSMSGAKRLIDAVRRSAAPDAAGEGESSAGIVDGRVAHDQAGVRAVYIAPSQSPSQSQSQSAASSGDEGAPAAQADGTEVLPKEKLLGSAAKTLGGYFVVERQKISE